MNAGCNHIDQISVIDVPKQQLIFKETHEHFYKACSPFHFMLVLDISGKFPQ
jgi:hypothetical protein